MKAICIDFDGVIYPNMNWMGTGVLQEEPIVNARQSLEKLSKEYKIVIHSSRFNDDIGYEAVKEWLLKHDFNYELSRYKPTAYIYLDDRGIKFDGDWNQAIKDIENFTQWQQNEKDKLRRFKRLNKRNMPTLRQ